MIEVSAGPSDAVSALAGMSPAWAARDEVPTPSADEAIASSAVRMTSSSENSEATAASASSAAKPVRDAHGGNKRHAITLVAMQAQKASGISGSPSGDEALARAVAQKGGGVESGGGVGTDTDISELEKVSAFISSYAGTYAQLLRSGSFLYATERCTECFKNSRPLL